MYQTTKTKAAQTLKILTDHMDNPTGCGSCPYEGIKETAGEGECTKRMYLDICDSISALLRDLDSVATRIYHSEYKWKVLLEEITDCYSMFMRNTMERVGNLDNK